MIDPFFGLFRTHRLEVGAQHAIAQILVDRTLPATLVTVVRLTGPAPHGVIWDFGASTRGSKLAFDLGVLSLSAGDSTPGDPGGVDGEVAAAFGSGHIGSLIRIVATMRPRSGLARLWLNGRRELDLVATAGVFASNQWTAGGTFRFGEQVGTANDRGTAVDTPPVDFELLEPLSLYQNQRQLGRS